MKYLKIPIMIRKKSLQEYAHIFQIQVQLCNQTDYHTYKKHFNDLELHLQKNIDITVKWITANRLVINPNKSTVMYVGTDKKN